MYDIHPLSGHFPSVTAAQYKKLKRDIRANGQMRPIALYEGMVWDGRARLQIAAPIVRSLDSPAGSGWMQ
jgi:hypothetical protein